MKKFTLLLSVVMCMAIGLKAQTYVGEAYGIPNIIPGQFTLNGHPYLAVQIDDNAYRNYIIFESDFITQVANINEDDIIAAEVSIYSDMQNSPYLIRFTQNLFNTDNNWEYFVKHDPVGESGYLCAYITINSSNGSVVTTINPSDGYYFIAYHALDIYVIDGNKYLVTNEGSDNNSVKHVVYQISQTQGLIKLDAELPLSVFPTVADRGQQITVELGEGNNATEITVVNELGQVVKRVPVNGQSSVTIPTTGLGSGMNILNTNTAKGNSGCKIIIR